MNNAEEMNSARVGQKPRDRGIETEMEKQGLLIDRLYESIEALESRLRPFIANNATKQGTDDPRPDCGPICALAQNICGYNERIEGATFLINAIKSSINL